VTRATRVAPLLGLALLAGCYTVRYERRSRTPEPGAAREQWHHGLLGGAIDASGRVKLAETCPDGVAAVENKVTLANGLISFFTSGGGLWLLRAPIWEPSTVRVWCARPAAATGKPLRLVLLPLASLGGVSADTGRLLGDALAGELRRRAGVSALTQADVAALLGVEKTRQMLGCTDAGCMAEIGGALGADRVVHGSIGRVGESLVVNLSALDPRQAAAAASVSDRLRGAGDEAFLDALPRLADALLAAPRPPAR
jgi:hypothetical protein